MERELSETEEIEIERDGESSRSREMERARDRERWRELEIERDGEIERAQAQKGSTTLICKSVNLKINSLSDQSIDKASVNQTLPQREKERERERERELAMGLRRVGEETELEMVYHSKI
ncbi:hypothetical protein F2Q69_00053934 [Brassica cretica]|uniref:Uncharacterized protein n=1 Tax=Brassica cretica TaxID=69181 RepID=A0A8S9N2S5_BRACR|nr:hypothetical protein F2Q69_00053934 [Brassica cretica]